VFVAPRAQAENVRVAQSRPGLIEVTYDLVSDDPRAVFSVTLDASDDGGQTVDTVSIVLTAATPNATPIVQARRNNLKWLLLGGARVNVSVSPTNPDPFATTVSTDTAFSSSSPRRCRWRARRVISVRERDPCRSSRAAGSRDVQPLLRPAPACPRHNLSGGGRFAGRSRQPDINVFRQASAHLDHTRMFQVAGLDDANAMLARCDRQQLNRRHPDMLAVQEHGGIRRIGGDREITRHRANGAAGVGLRVARADDDQWHDDCESELHTHLRQFAVRSSTLAHTRYNGRGGRIEHRSGQSLAGVFLLRATERYGGPRRPSTPIAGHSLDVAASLPDDAFLPHGNHRIGGRGGSFVTVHT
jgi:hypothetical protein